MKRRDLLKSLVGMGTVAVAGTTVQPVSSALIPVTPMCPRCGSHAYFLEPWVMGTDPMKFALYRVGCGCGWHGYSPRLAGLR